MLGLHSLPLLTKVTGYMQTNVFFVELSPTLATRRWQKHGRAITKTLSFSKFKFSKQSTFFCLFEVFVY
jgi:hypothetical protein